MNAELPKSKRHASSNVKTFTKTKGNTTYKAFVRYDDTCRNGHNSFAITGEEIVGGRVESCGCLHEMIAEQFPDLAPYIKWHSVTTDGPLCYVANTLYHASSKDHRGLLKGEQRQLRNGKTGQLCWKMIVMGEQYIDSDECPTPPIAYYEPWMITGEGKERNLDYARSSAVWPDASDEDLISDDLSEKLIARLPALMEEFKSAVESLGFVY